MTYRDRDRTHRRRVWRRARWIGTIAVLLAAVWWATGDGPLRHLVKPASHLWSATPSASPTPEPSPAGGSPSASPSPSAAASAPASAYATVTPPTAASGFPPAPATAKSELATLVEARNRDSEHYQRGAFGPGWSGEGHYPKLPGGCEARDEVLRRDLTGVKAGDRNRCIIFSGTLTDPFTGAVHPYSRYKPSQIQIDHVVALGAAWRSGASTWTQERRVQFANDIDDMLAVDKRANQDKSSKTPDQWKPQRSSWCSYASRWVGIKKRYGLSVTTQEKAALGEMLGACPAG
ncbi:HNH endonuclease [Actinomadura barringtoniae]|uniref:HNH endonuclease n=1 Tax=Actinomadura barringtoniae TaxID=1427535 RepID=A0A939PCB8_9ACTN|nr:HNH endonuclease family protein [Actinomadura barringtoniae]MBO2450026.1 HNH endonuclease [Actinomadura barringtoniae]